MSSLTPHEKSVLEVLFSMSDGYVLHFSDSTFGTFFGTEFDIDIHSKKYQTIGTSKAKKLREFWNIEPDEVVGASINSMVAQLLAKREEVELQFEWQETDSDNDRKAKEDKLIVKARAIANRLCSGGTNLQFLKDTAKPFDAAQLAQQISRMEKSIQEDPALAIGTSKELIETCCKTILAERNIKVKNNWDVSELTKAVIKELKLTADNVSDSSKGSKIIKRILSNLATIGVGIAELRNLYGTGHGKHGNTQGLSSRHAKLAVGTVSTLVTFLFETHQETKAEA